MAAILMDGKAVSARIREEAADAVRELSARGITPCLAVILVGEDPASKIYVRNKKIACRKCGILSREVLLPETATEEEVLLAVDQLNADPAVSAILVQMPLPKGLSETRVLDRILPEKDADGFHVTNAGLLFTGRASVVPGTPAGCMELLKQYGIPISGRRAVVIGRSNIVGKPMAALLLDANATVTVCHSRTQDIASITREADILVVAVGRAGFVTGDMVKRGAVVIDVGINRLPDGKIAGDCDFDSVSAVAGYITPVPGGVGPMTVAMLMKSTVHAAVKANE